MLLEGGCAACNLLEGGCAACMFAPCNCTRILIILLAAFAVVQVLLRVFRKCFHFPAPALFGPLLDSRIRKILQPPDRTISRSGISEGMRVLEIGCGSGAFTTAAARAVGKGGSVYALDVQSKMLEQLKEKLAKPENRDIDNITLIHGNAYSLPFNNHFFDAVYMVTVLQEIPDRFRALQEVRRVLKPGGIIAVTEFLPDPDYPLKGTTIRILSEAGFVFDQASGNLWNYTVRSVVRK